MDRTSHGHNRDRSPTHVEVASRETDAMLAARAATDSSAFAELYQRYVVRIHRYCSRRLADADLAEDATSQVFLKALESLQHKRIDNVPSWLFSSAHNEVVDRYRRQHHHRSIDDLHHLASGSLSPEEAVLGQLDAIDLRALLPLLTADQQRVIELRLAGLTNSEIRDVLGKGKSWVTTTQFRALHALRKLLDEPRTGKGGPP